MRRLLIPLLCAATLGACAVGPDYVRPTIDAPQSWRFNDGEARELANSAWWKQLQDPVLDGLIRTALVQNKEVLIAAARVEEFRGRLGATRSQLFPRVGADLGGSRQRASELGASGAPPRNPFNAVQVDASVSWELDVFGRLRRLTEAARADLLASEEGRRATLLSLISSVAASYVNLRDLDRQLEIARRTVQSRREALDLFELRFRRGVVSQLELAQARSEYQRAASTVPSLEQAIARRENALSVLLGSNPEEIPRGRPIDALTVPGVPAGLPSDLLERRPDLRQAEQNLVAANADIGAARALYFPTITLTGLLGAASTSLSGLWSGPGQLWSFAGGLGAPILTAGGIAGQVHVAEAQQQQALHAYERAIQIAFQEFNDALIGTQKSRVQLASQGREVDALRDYARFARLRYDGGYSSYLEVLDAERSLFNTELEYTQTQGALLQQAIGLYKAMGGGWVVEADRLTFQPARDAEVEQDRDMARRQLDHAQRVAGG